MFCKKIYINFTLNVFTVQRNKCIVTKYWCSIYETLCKLTKYTNCDENIQITLVKVEPYMKPLDVEKLNLPTR